MCTNKMDIQKSFTQFCYEYLIILKEIHRLYEYPYAVIMFYYSISSQIVHYYIHNEVVNLKQPAIIFSHVLCMQSDYPPPPFFCLHHVLQWGERSNSNIKTEQTKIYLSLLLH